MTNVPQTPLTHKSNAHGFDRDHLCGTQIDLCTAESFTADHVVYYVPYDQQSMDFAAGLDCKKIFFSSADYEKQIMARMLTKIRTESDLLIHLQKNWSMQQYAPMLMKHAKKMLPNVPNRLLNSIVVDYKTMFYDLSNDIDRIMHWCGFNPNQDRRSTWQLVYNQWQRENIDNVCATVEKFDQSIDKRLEKEIAKFLYTWWKQR